MIDKLRAVEECDYDIAGEYIYKRFLNALECKPAPKLYELLNNYLVPSDQKFNDCVASNLKAGIRNLFFGFDAHQLDLQKMTAHYEVYKSFCSMLKEEIPYLLELNQ